ncbi:MAG TPA: Rid family hydrolase [Nocardioides sp.]|uniref:Rid family hydrolase n=1 Tax=Nocardioides sp. TaxID=35761 RepID=UPI002C14C184|nr:Rid family hydrolase [Nocardioides sp.]HTW15375.1 Rid family hydrolase [Nocardioides sp.]
MTLAAIKPASFPWFPYEGFTFCLGLTEGDAAWTSGHTSARQDETLGKMTVSGTMTEQAEIAYAKCLAILEAAGFGPEDVTRVTENVTKAGLHAYEDQAEVRRRIFGERPTVRTVVVERLVRRAAWLEVELHAVKGGGQQLRVASASREAGNWQASSITEGADGVVYLPTVVPIDEHGEVVHPGDFVAQYRYVLEKAGALLESVGLTLGHAVTTFDYSTPETRDVYRKTHWVRKELLGQNDGNVFPCAGGILMSELHAPGVMVAMDVTASRRPLELVNPGWSRYDTLTYAPGIKAGRMLFMSGFASLDMETQQALHDGDLGAQAEVTYGAIVHLLESEGLSPVDLLETTEYCVESYVGDYKAVADVRERLLSAPWPASTGALCHSLLRPEFGLEVFPTAVYPENHPRIAGA